uniref:carbonyl reductase (NADPH) n=1 Tax=Lygus hesperus TaxID=30085 RepID=A0A146LAV6_LYGHE
MSNRVAVVTGSNKGIGLEIVKNLCSKFDGTVILTARDERRGQDAVKKLNQENLHPVFHQLDVDNVESINSLASFIKTKYGGLDILVNNAGIVFQKDAKESFGVQAELTLKTNYFSLKKVCDTLYPLLRPHARVVTLTSLAGHSHMIPDVDLRKKFCDPNLTEEALDALMLEFIDAANDGSYLEKGWHGHPYFVSKVGASALSRIHHQKFLKDPREDIVINHVHPGWVDTDLTNHEGPLTVVEGAVAPTYAALLPENCQSPKGDMIWFNKEICDWVNGPVLWDHFTNQKK